MKKVKGKYRKATTALKKIKTLLKEYYRLDKTPRNEWGFNRALADAERQLKENGQVRIEGAQWGGKWGNYKRCIALNSKGEYVYVEGFDNDIKKSLG